MPGPDIFISYNREDSAIAQTYRDALSREGFDVWWDATLRPGETYDEVTEEALRAAKAVIVLWSPRSVASRWVRAEATIADRNKTMVPVTIEACDRPVMFELTQTVDMSHWRGDADDREWLGFIETVRRKTGRDGAPVAKPAPVAAPARPGPAGDAYGRPFVAIVPFSHRGDDVIEFLAEDLGEEITRILGRNNFFKVVSATAMSAWRGKAVDYKSLSKELNARYAVEGKLQRAGDNIRLTLQVVDTETAGAVWAPKFVRKAEELEHAPDEFARDMANRLSEHLLQAEVDRALARPGQLTGWEYVLRASTPPIRRMGVDTIAEALGDARKAVELAPDLGFAHAVLAGLIGSVMTHGTDDLDDATRQEIQTHIRRAMQLDGDNARVLLAIVGAYGAIGDIDAGLRLARRAVELDPNSAQIHFALGRAYMTKGLTADAIATLATYLRLGAEDHMRLPALALYGASLFVEGKPDEAEAAIDQALGLHPDFGVGLKWKAILAAERGREDEAGLAMRRLRETEPGLTLDQHLGQIVLYPALRERVSSAVATFERLWSETGAVV